MKTLYSPIASRLARLTRDERGATAIEYALIAGGLSIAIAGIITLLGTRVGELFQSVSTAWPS